MEQIIHLMVDIRGLLAGIALMDVFIAMCMIAVAVRVYRIDWR